MALGTTSSGGGAVAQPTGGAARLPAACVASFGLVTLGLAVWAYVEVTRASGGVLGAPLDDSYIHFQFARSFAQFRPFEYAAGQPRVPGATSLLWPALMVPALWLGAGGAGLVKLTWLLSFGALFGQAREVFLASLRFLSLPFAFAAGLLVLSFSANTWFAASAMEVVPLGFVLLRSARLAAEYFEGARSRRREHELIALATISVLLRPEGVLGALLVGAALLGARRFRWAGLALGMPLLVPLVNLLFTGHAAQTTTLAKWLPTNPYYAGRLGEALLGNVQLFIGTLLDGREWSWTFIPNGYRWVGLATLPALCWAAERRGARAHAVALAMVGFGILIPTSYETFLVNRLRYLWPFSAPWLLGLAALGQLVASALSRLSPRLAWAALALPAACGFGFAQLAPISVGDLAVSCSAITAQQVSLGQWAGGALPPKAKLGVNDAGAIAFYSNHPTFDVVGLTTQGEAQHWVAGAGSRFEHYERLPRATLPTHFIVYPEWFGLPGLLGRFLTSRRVEGATILGGPLMVAYEADYTTLGSGAHPTLDVAPRRLLDELDVADLESEAAHDYALGVSSAQLNVVIALGGAVDGGRAGRTWDDFHLNVAPAGLIIVRLSASPPAELSVSVAGKPAITLTPSAHELEELAFEVPANTARGVTPVTLHSREPVTVLHYWSYGAR